MKRPFSEQLSIFIGALVGIVTTGGSVFAGENSLDRSAITKQLIEAGLIAPHRNPGWFVVNRALVDQSLRDSEVGLPDQKSTIEKLKEIVGSDVDIRQVDIFQARVGTQDHM